MRFGFLVMAVVAGGALMGAAAQFMISPQAQNSGAPQSSAATKVSFDLSDLNPIKLIFDGVKQQVETGANRPSFAVGTPVPIADFSKIDAQIKLNDENFRRMGNSGGIGQLPQNGPR